MTIWDYANNSPWLVFFLCICALFVIEAVLLAPFRIAKRWIRHLDIKEHGWPTASFMDADGDIIHPEKD